MNTVLTPADEDDVDENVDSSSVGPGSLGSVGGGGPNTPGAGGVGGGPGSSSFPRLDDNASNIKAFQSRLEDLRTCNDLIVKHAAALHKSLAELEATDATREDLVSRTKTVNERATLFRISSNAMVNVSTKNVNERATLFRIASNVMVIVSIGLGFTFCRDVLCHG